MVVIQALINITKSAWDTLSRLKVDGISWTTIIIAFIIVFLVLGGFLHARR